MFYHLPQGWPPYQRIDTLFKRITWRRYVHTNAMSTPRHGSVRSQTFVTMHTRGSWRAFLYKWLPRRSRGVPEQVVSQCRGLLSPCLPPISQSQGSPILLAPERWNLLHFFFSRAPPCCVIMTLSCHVILIALNIGLQIHSVCLASLISKCKLTYKQMNQDPCRIMRAGYIGTVFINKLFCCYSCWLLHCWQ